MHIPVALHTIGQTPRPDLTPFIMASVNTPLVTVTGALDDADPAQIPEPDLSSGHFPLETRLSDGARIETDASFLEPLIQAQIDKLDEAVELHLVLCAGPFPNLKAEGLLIRPFEHACDVFAANGLGDLLVVVPFDSQSDPSAKKWADAGFSTKIRSMDERPAEMQADAWLTEIGADSECDALVLDYVGYPKAIWTKVADSISIPVYDLGYLAAEFAREIIDEAKALNTNGG